MKRFYLTSLFIVLSYFAFAQHSHRAYRKLADSLYLHHHYESAASYYQRALKKAEESDSIMLQIAKCYSRTNNALEATQWFQKAKSHQAHFSHEDVYQYAGALMMLEKYDEAGDILEELLTSDPNALYARQLLDDTRHIDKYFKDSSNYTITPLSINTPVSEFAPAYYKNGIVFSSATPEHFAKKKYHWDNSHFLNLFYSEKINDHNFQKPVTFNKELNTRFHDGPATFYAGNERMIINHNQSFQLADKKDSWVWHLTLYEGKYVKKKNTWDLSPLPFNEPYAFMHPSITEDGNTLYFSSDRPGGYGGMDIYRVVRENGSWSSPFNLGPTINTTENEVFPFIANNTLYFASNGHGGLGGLDIFKSEWSINGFTPPINLSYPINSHVDDFSLITKNEQEGGYFSSARSGNDDLYHFSINTMIEIAARVFDGLSRKPVQGAQVHIFSTSAPDLILTSDSLGYVRFNLSEEAAYVAIGSKNGKAGMITGLATPEADHEHVIHQIPVFGDQGKVPCIGHIKNEMGIAQRAAKISVVDETTGENIFHASEQAFINFFGEKGHAYRIEIESSQGDTATHRFTVNEDGSAPQTWDMLLNETPVMIDLVARVFDAATNEPLGGAKVKVITFADPDKEFTADENGVVEFVLPENAAYILVGTKDSLTGMHSGLAEQKMSKSYVIHPVPAKGDPLKPVPVVALVTDKQGKILPDATAIVTDKTSGENIPVETKGGVLRFFGEHKKEYNISVAHDNYESTLEEISIITDAPAIEKIAVVLEEIKPESVNYLMAVQVLNEQGIPVENALLQIINPVDGDIELLSDHEGKAQFQAPEGSAYMVIATKDDYSGLHSGVAEKETDKSFVTHTILLNKEASQQLPVLGLLVDEAGTPISNASIKATDSSSGDNVPVKYENGILYFEGKKGSSYTVEVTSPDHESQIQNISIPPSTSRIDPLEFHLVSIIKKIPVSTFITTEGNVSLSDLSVVVTDKKTGENISSELLNGELIFSGKQGKEYAVAISHEKYIPVSEEITIPLKATSVKNTPIILTENISPAMPPIPVAISLTGKNGRAINNAVIYVTDKLSREKRPVEVKEGILAFNAEQGRQYEIVVEHEDYNTAVKDITIPRQGTFTENISILLEEKPVYYTLAARVFKEQDNSPLGGANVKIMRYPEPDIEVVANDDGIVEFTLQDGSPYILVGSKGNYTGMLAGVAEKMADKNYIIHPVPVRNDSSLVPVVAKIENSDNGTITESDITVTKKTSGEKIDAGFIRGMLSFYAEKGNEYDITIRRENRKPIVTPLIIPEASREVQTLSIDLPEQHEQVQSFVTAVQVVRGKNKSPLSGAEIKVLSFSQPDMVLSSNKKGQAEFSLPDGSAYIAIASKDNYTGMHTGIVEANSSKEFVIHPILVSREHEDELPVLGMIVDNTSTPVKGAMAYVTDQTSGERVDTKIENGIVYFFGKKGRSYKIEITSAEYASQQKIVYVDPNASILPPLEINLGSPMKKAPASLSIPAYSKLVIVKDGNQTDKFYILAGESHYEITERNDSLFLQNSNELLSMGKGTLSHIKENPDEFVGSLGLTSGEVITLQNIYFDFNKSTLDETDKQELTKVKSLLQQYPFLQLSIRAHADDRGSEIYNMNLSRRRAKTIATYLSKEGIKSDRLIPEAYGESTPAVPCSEPCTEEEYEKNRRAEFILNTSAPVAKTPVSETTEFSKPTTQFSKPIVAKSQAKSDPKDQLALLIEKYGDRQLNGLVFKVSVGAYRFNPNLTFQELSDLGNIEKQLTNGINYYYLGDFPSFRTAEEVRQEVVKRGISDAYLSIFYNGSKISFSKFTALTR